MLLIADVKSLEVVTCAYLSQDATLCDEVRRGLDFHKSNQDRFKLPSRTIAKIFMFKLIYGASAWGYANDGDFTGVSTNDKFWQRVIDEFYAKYTGIKAWHNRIVSHAQEFGEFLSPTGRTYKYPPNDVVSRLWFWRPKILNYPVQGLGADLVMLFRISLWNRLRGTPGVQFVSSVHDNIVLDIQPDLCYSVARQMKEACQAVPENFKRQFGKEFNLPLNVEIKAGNDLLNTEKLEC